MPKSRLKSVSKHRNNIVTPAKREYKFFDVATIKISTPIMDVKFVNNFLHSVDKNLDTPEVKIV